jgi:hypothetical protein
MTGASRVAQTLKQRGVLIATAGFIVQMLSMIGAVGGTTGGIAVVLFFGSAGATIASFVGVKDRTGLSNGLISVAFIAVVISAIANGGSFVAVIAFLVGSAITYFGNGQLAQGIRAN